MPPLPDTPAQTEHPARLGEIIADLARRMADGRLGPGDLAGLRRLDVLAPDRPAFWRVAATLLRGPGTPLPPEAETRWAMVLSGMARMAPRPHDPRRSVGQALAEVGFHELRLTRLLRTTGPAFADSVRRLSGFLAAKGSPVNWVELASLILATTPEKAEVIRRKIARDYYGTLVRGGRR